MQDNHILKPHDTLVNKEDMEDYTNARGIAKVYKRENVCYCEDSKSKVSNLHPPTWELPDCLALSVKIKNHANYSNTICSSPSVL